MGRGPRSGRLAARVEGCSASLPVAGWGMARKFNQPLSVILIGFCLLLGGAAGAGNAAEPVIINRLAVVHLDGSAGDLQPGQPLQIQFSLSLTASATLTLDQPEGVLAMFVNLTLQGSATYCTEFVPTTPGPHTFRLEATDGTTSDAATRAYDVGPHDDPRRPAKIELLTTSRGRDSASYVAGETVRVFFRVDNDAMATLGLERSDLSSGQLVFRDFPLPGGQTYHVDLLADAQGSWVLRLTALAATTEEQTCAFMVGRRRRLRRVRRLLRPLTVVLYNCRLRWTRQVGWTLGSMSGAASRSPLPPPDWRRMATTRRRTTAVSGKPIRVVNFAWPEGSAG
jgi:hypothetical protein